MWSEVEVLKCNYTILNLTAGITLPDSERFHVKPCDHNLFFFWNQCYYNAGLELSLGLLYFKALSSFLLLLILTAQFLSLHL